MNYKQQLTIPLLLLSLSTFTFATNYFDGEDGTVGNWKVHDNKPAGATIINIIDDTKNSKVIEFKGEGRFNSYMLGTKNWSNTTEKVLKWSMNFSEKFKITVYLKTKKGVRTLFYDYKNMDKGLYKEKYIKFGLGSQSKNGTWQNFVRDIEADLKKYEPDNELLKIKGMKVQGSGRMDDVRLEKKGEVPPENACITRQDLDIKIKNNEDITNVDTSCIKDMSRLFADNITFNQDIGTWDVSNVTNMSSMFEGARSFNQNLAQWDVSSVTNMEGMFAGNSFKYSMSFNQDITQWDVSNVTNMRAMFYLSSSFNQNIGNWNVSSVTNMESMFGDTRFDQDIGRWNVSNVTNMSNMFGGSRTIFNQDISQWDVSNVTRMNAMFFGDVNFNQNIGRWDVSKVTNMSEMFSRAVNFNQDLSQWDVSSVTNMGLMFDDASMFTNHDLSQWNVNNVTYHFGFLNGAGANNIEPNWVQ